MATPIRRHVEPPHLWVQEILHGRHKRVRRLRVTLQELVPVHDLQHPLGAGAVGDVDAVAEGNGAVEPFGRRPRGAGLLARQAEVPDEARLRRVAQIVDLGHPVCPPARRTSVRDQVGDPRIALPPVLVGTVEPLDHRHHVPGLRRRAHVPHLVGEVAERAQEIRLGGVSLGQRSAVADARHGGPAPLGLARRAGDVVEIARLTRVRDVHDGGTVLLRLPGQRVEPSAAMVADIGYPTLTLAMDHGLVGRARLEIVLPDQAHIPLLGLLGPGGPAEHGAEQEQETYRDQAAYTGITPCFFQGRSTFLVAAISRARIRTGRVSRGSMTSSMKAPPAAM